MLTLLISFLLLQTYTETIWTKYGATLENTHYQIMRGAMHSAPYVKWSYQAGNHIEFFGPSVADVDDDGVVEVVVGSCDKKVYCLTGTNGNLKWSYTTGDYVISSPR